MTGTKIISNCREGRGFTLVELVVVMAVFLFVIGIAISVFLSIIKHQKIILSEQKILNQLNYVQEHMSKALRMAKAEGCGDAEEHAYVLTREDVDCSPPNDDKQCGYYRGIKFTNQSDGDACTEFFLDNTPDPANPVLKEIKNGGDAVALTSPDLKINFVRFSLDGCINSQNALCEQSSGTYGSQGRVTVLLNVQFPDDSTRSIQTTISQRNLGSFSAPSGTGCSSVLDCDPGQACNAGACVTYTCTDDDANNNYAMGTVKIFIDGVEHGSYNDYCESNNITLHECSCSWNAVDNTYSAQCWVPTDCLLDHRPCLDGACKP